MTVQDFSMFSTIVFTDYSMVYELPYELIFNNCNVSLILLEIHFLGGVIGKELDEHLAPELEDYLETNSQEIICNELTNVISQEVSFKMNESNVYREILIDAGRSLLSSSCY